MKGRGMIYGGDYDESAEHSKDLDHNKGKSTADRGFIADDNDFCESGPSERKNSWGETVTHQDSRTYPQRKDY